MEAGVIRVVLPYHLRQLAGAPREVELEVGEAGGGPVSQRTVLDALELRYPVLRGTVRDHGTLKRRPMIRFYACQEDLSHESAEAPLPEAVVAGKEPFYVVAAIAGG